MRVLLTGAGGFIGSQVRASLLAAGHTVVACTRSGDSAAPGPASAQLGPQRIQSAAARQSAISCDFASDNHPETWLPRLEAIDAVVNCAGILRERGNDRFERVHVETPTALFSACVKAGVMRVIQISALGKPADTEFIASKHRGDARLMCLDLDWVILRPSIVYSPDGSYGGTSLLRAMAALPGVVLVPGTGQQQVSPVSAADLADLIVRLLERRGGDSRRILEVAGPETLSLEAYLKTWRHWLGFAPPRVIGIPLSFVAIASWLGERFGSGPLGMSMYRMLMSGSTAAVGSDASLVNTVGWQPKRLADVLQQRPSFVQDHWHARLYFLAPLLRIAMALVWIGSSCVGFVTPSQQIEAVMAPAGIVAGAVSLDYFASAVDLLLGVALLFSWRTSLVGSLMLGSLLAYTVFATVALPSTWWEPFGGVLKNVVLMPAVLIMMVVAKRK